MLARMEAQFCSSAKSPAGDLHCASASLGHRSLTHVTSSLDCKGRSVDKVVALATISLKCSIGYKTQIAVFAEV